MLIVQRREFAGTGRRNRIENKEMVVDLVQRVIWEKKKLRDTEKERLVDCDLCLQNREVWEK